MTTNGNGSDKSLGLGKLLAYSSGQFGGNILNYTMAGWIIYFYTDTEKGPPYLSIFIIGAIGMLVGRIADGIYDPIIGYWSDTTRTRWGRRIPFILLSTPFYAGAFTLLFNPLFPKGSAALAVFTILLISVYFFFFTANMVPYLALMPEISTSNSDRVKTTTFMTIAGLLANLYAMVAVPKLFPVLGESGVFTMTGGLAVIFILVTVFLVKEKPMDAATAAPVNKKEYSLLYAFRLTFRNKAFTNYIAASFCQYIGFAALTSSLPFVVTRLMDKPKDYVGNLFGAAFPGMAVSFVIINWLVKSRGVEKAKLYKVCLFLLAAFMPLMFLLNRVDLGVPPHVAGMIFMVLMSFPITGNQVLPMAILADITDYDEKLTGMRREGVYFSMQGFLQKIATALSLGMQSILFGVFGFAVGGPRDFLGVSLLGPIAGLFGLVGFLIFLKYPLDEKTKEMKSA